MLIQLPHDVVRGLKNPDWQNRARDCCAAYGLQVADFRANTAGWSVDLHPQHCDAEIVQACERALMRVLSIAAEDGGEADAEMAMIQGRTLMTKRMQLSYTPRTNVQAIRNWEAVIGAVLADAGLDCLGIYPTRRVLLIQFAGEGWDGVEQELVERLDRGLREALLSTARPAGQYVDQSIRVSGNHGQVQIAAHGARATQMINISVVKDTRETLALLRDIIAEEADEGREVRKEALDAIKAATADTSAEKVERTVSLVANMTSIAKEAIPHLVKLITWWSLTSVQLPTL